MMRATSGGRPPPAVDLLQGVKAIATFLGMTRHAAQHRADAGLIPTFKMGGTVCATRTGLTAWLDERTAQAAADAARRLGEREER